jgi:lipooligosaccharide transport system permease protein
MAHPALTVLERHLLLYRRLWRASAFSFFALPTLFLISLGKGVGSYVGHIDGVSYLTWIAPALLVSTAFQIGINESTYGVLIEFEWVGGLHAMRATRVRITDMITGWLLYVLAVTELAVAAFLCVMAAFGTLTAAVATAAPLVGGLIAVAVAAPTTAFSATLHNQDYFVLLSRFLVIPATLFSGVYFPVQQLPWAIRPLAYLSPLWHAVALIRAAAFGGASPGPVILHTGYLLLLTLLGYLWARRAFRHRLTR